MKIQKLVFLPFLSACVSSAILSSSEPMANSVGENSLQITTLSTNSDIQNDNPEIQIQAANDQNITINGSDLPTDLTNSSIELPTNLNDNTITTVSTESPVLINSQSSGNDQNLTEITNNTQNSNADGQIVDGSQNSQVTNGQGDLNIQITSNEGSTNDGGNQTAIVTEIPIQQPVQPVVNNSTSNVGQVPNVGGTSTDSSSSQKVDLKGNFSAAFPNLPTINLIIDSGRLSFSECNVNSFPFEAYENGSFIITGPGISTLRACLQEDNDRLYSAELQSVDGYSQNNGTIVLTKGNELVATLTANSNGETSSTVDPPTQIPPTSTNTTVSINTTNSNNTTTIPVINTTTSINNSSGNTTPVASSGNIQGKYRIFVSAFSVPSIAASIGSRTIEFFGCNSVSIRYETLSNGTFKTARPAISTYRFCPSNNDSKYIDAILSANTFLKDQTGIHLSRNGRRVASFFSGSSANATRNSLQQPRKLTLANQNLPAINAVVTEQCIKLSGCNNFIINYESFSNGFFRLVGPILSTRKFCPNNNDDKYIQAFKSANTFQLNGSTLVLLDGTKKVAEIGSSCF